MAKKINSSKFSRSSKGQAAMEFLTTYGWMFMIVLAVFGGLVYFGFADAQEQIPTNCRIDFPFECKAFFAYELGSYSVEIKNIDSQDIDLTHFVCGFPQTEELIRYNYSDLPLSPGELRTYYCSSAPLSDSLFIAGKDLFKMKIAYNYVESDPIPIVVNGELVAPASDDTVLLNKYIANAATPSETLLITP